MREEAFPVNRRAKDSIRTLWKNIYKTTYKKKKQLIRKCFNNPVTRRDLLPRHKTQKAQRQIWLQKKLNPSCNKRKLTKQRDAIFQLGNILQLEKKVKV